jgi:hypothetical protein
VVAKDLVIEPGMTVEGSQTVQATAVRSFCDALIGGSASVGRLPNQPGWGHCQGHPTEGEGHHQHREDSARPVDVYSGDREVPARYDQEQATGQRTPTAVANCHHRGRDRRQRQSPCTRDIVGDVEEPADLGTFRSADAPDCCINTPVPMPAMWSVTA